MTDADHRTIALVMRRLALDAGNATEAVRGRAGLAVANKSDRSPVSEADLAADRVIVEGLTAAFTGIAIVTEERAETHGAAPDRFFLVDPLDGTKEFVTGSGEYTVNIALIEDGLPVLGVVYAPAIARLFWTPAPGEAAREDLGSEAAGAYPVHARQAPSGGIVAVCSRSHGNSATEAYLASYPVVGKHRAGSSLKFCLVAAGEADIYPRLARTMEWDTGAGHAVLAAAGGKVSGRDGTSLRYGKTDFVNAGFVAAGPGLAVQSW